MTIRELRPLVESAYLKKDMEARMLEHTDIAQAKELREYARGCADTLKAILGAMDDDRLQTMVLKFMGD